jgi:protocatechuate 3,4-dioxygenase alpha subunit
MVQKLDYLAETPSQTAGPYVHIGLAPQAAGFEIFHNVLGAEMAPKGVPGERIRVEGSVLDGNGATVKDVLIEIWQADSTGRYADGTGPFRGFGRVVPDFATGLFGFDTIRPGAVKGPEGRLHAPHLSLWLVARGINTGLQTRMYFPDADNATDPVMARVEPHRRATLVATADGPGRLRFDIRLQGEAETVFLDI